MKTKPNFHHWYGWKKDEIDLRDIPFLPGTITRPALPTRADLVAPVMTDVFLNQGAEGSCTAHGSLFCDIYAKRMQKTADAQVMPSRAMQYYNTRLIEHTQTEDSGGQIRDAIKALAKYGVCQEQDFPYIVGGFATKPSKANYAAALNDQLLQYRKIADGDLYAIKAALASGKPVVFGFQVYQQFESAQCAKDGLVALPPALAFPVGGHCVAAIAYDDAQKWQYTGYLRCRNSWGKGWGAGGDFYLPYQYIAERGLASDFWVLDRVE